MTNWELEEMRDAYAPDDPKHPDWEDLAADRADTERKRLKEQGPYPRPNETPDAYVKRVKAMGLAEGNTITTTEGVPMELEVLDPAEEIVLFTGNPADKMAQMKETAQIITEPVRQLHTVKISGKEYVRVEGWTMLGNMLGVKPNTVWSRQMVDGLGEPGWEARVEARTHSGEVVGTAEAQCTRSEKSWKGRDDFSLRSMAQTRATSKALRQSLGSVMSFAGFEATPAEEMDSTAFKAPTAGGHITEPQSKKIFLLRDKLTKASLFTIEQFDSSLQQAYGTTRVNELSREDARDLIDRLEKVEPT